MDEGQDASDLTPVDVASTAGIEAADPLALIRVLEASDRFRRDTPLGGILHPGKISFRETTRTDSMHVLIHGTSVSAHIDEVSPLRCDPDGRWRYAWLPVVSHNVKGLLADLGRRVRGRHGEQRCDLDCEIVWVDDDDETAPPSP